MSTATTMAVTMPAVQTPQLKELHASFGAEITGLNFANGVTIEGQKMILDAVIKVNTWLLVVDELVNVLIFLFIVWSSCSSLDRSYRRDSR